MSGTFTFTCHHEEMNYTVKELEDLDSNCITAERLTVQKYLKIYSSACTSGIINVACNDCGSLAENCVEEDFEANNLLDPDFPCTGCDEGTRSVGEYLADYTSSRVEDVVGTLLAMEKSWEKRITGLNVNQYVIANKLWIMGQHVCTERVHELHGPDMAAEFREFGEDLFG